MKTSQIKTKIFLDSGSIEDTEEAISLLGFLDGQTTNPSLITKNILSTSIKSLSKKELTSYYKNLILNISKKINNKPLSVEVYSDINTTTQELINQALEINQWSSNIYIKLPLTTNGIEAMGYLLNKGIKCNLTLVFSQEQALITHLASKNINFNKGDLYISAFIGRLEDIGVYGLDLISNIIKMYKKCNSKIELIGASIRNIEQLFTLLYFEIDIVTLPISLIREWVNVHNCKVPKNIDELNTLIEPSKKKLKQIEYVEYNESNQTEKWEDLNISHELTTKGLLKFANDWNLVFK